MACLPANALEATDRLSDRTPRAKASSHVLYESILLVSHRTDVQAEYPWAIPDLSGSTVWPGALWKAYQPKHGPCEASA